MSFCEQSAVGSSHHVSWIARRFGVLLSSAAWLGESHAGVCPDFGPDMRVYACEVRNFVLRVLVRQLAGLSDAFACDSVGMTSHNMCFDTHGTGFQSRKMRATLRWHLHCRLVLARLPSARLNLSGFSLAVVFSVLPRAFLAVCTHTRTGLYGVENSGSARSPTSRGDRKSVV